MDGGGAILRSPSRERLVPPAPVPPAHDLSIPELWLRMRSNGVSAWPEHAYDDLVAHRRFFGVNHYVLNDPAAARQVMRDKADDYVRPVSMHRILGPGIGTGLLLAEGEAWRRQRRTMAAAFTPQMVGRLLPHFRGAALTMTGAIADGERVNLADRLQAATIDSFGRAMLSLPMSGRAQRIIPLAREYFADLGRPMFWDLLARTPEDFPWALRARKAWSRRWFAEIASIIAERRATPLPGDAHPDALEILTAWRDPDGRALDDRAIRDEIASMVVAGFESTSRLLIWAVYLLGRDPEEQAALRRELTLAPPDQVRSVEDLKAWPGLANVLMETLRLYPPVPSTIRMARRPDQVSGIDIRPGDHLVVSPWLMHRHRRWWDRPEAFLPERFTEAPQRLRDGAFIPFGVGRRVCVGATFAIAEASLILAELLNRFEIELDDDRPVMPIGNTTLTPSIEPWFRLRARPQAPRRREAK